MCILKFSSPNLISFVCVLHPSFRLQSSFIPEKNEKYPVNHGSIKKIFVLIVDHKISIMQNDQVHSLTFSHYQIEKTEKVFTSKLEYISSLKS